MSTAKHARRDAHEYARAKMFYGEGAGNRRKLIEASVESKMMKDSKYASAFRAELERQDMGEHAAKARAERNRMDRNEAISRNTKAVLNGNSKSMNTGVLVLSAAVYVAHQTGLDVKIYAKGKQLYGDLKAKYRRAKKPDTQNVYNIYNTPTN